MLSQRGDFFMPNPEKKNCFLIETFLLGENNFENTEIFMLKLHFFVGNKSTVYYTRLGSNV